jgi:hypothetical protein
MDRSKTTYFHWRSKYVGASVDELKRMYAELALRPEHERPFFSISSGAVSQAL